MLFKPVWCCPIYRNAWINSKCDGYVYGCLMVDGEKYMCKLGLHLLTKLSIVLVFAALKRWVFWLRRLEWQRLSTLIS